MKENLISDKSLTYQWYFNDNISICDNPRVKATVFGNPTYNNGIATFNGSTDYYKLKTLINLGTKHSIEMKIKLNGLNGNPRILSLNSLNGIFIEKDTNKVYYRCNNVTTSTAINVVSLNQFLTLSICRNSSNLIIYVNGVVVLTTTYSATENFIFDKIGWDSLNGLFNGQLEYIKIWNRQLSPAEVKNNYNGKTYRALSYVSGEILGSEIVSNNGYDTDTYWVKQLGWTINNGTAICTNIPGTGAIYYPVPTVVTGKLYKITYTILQCTAGSGFAAGVGNNIGQYRTIVGTYTDYLNCGSTQNVGIYAVPGTSGVIDNISVKEVTQSSKNTLFHINSDNGVIRDLTGKTNPVATNVQLPKIGSNINVMKFDGLSGNVNIGSQALVGDITFMGWVNNRIGYGESSRGTYISNGNTMFVLSGGNGGYFFTRDNEVTKSNYNSFGNKPTITRFFCITSTSTGITNFYIGDKNNPPTLSGIANQNAGTPVSGSTCYIGNRAADDRTLNGWLNDVRMEQSILTLEEITQIWSNTKIKY